MGTLSAQVSATGISAPAFSDILAQLKNIYWTIYGSDANLDDDSQDGQFLNALAQAIYDNNMLAVAIYNAFSPAYAQGVGLSSVVKINGIRRQGSSASFDTVTLTGVANTIINGGLIGDNLGLGTQWSIPDGTTIGAEGTVDATATCTTQGAITVGANSLTRILTPINGWQSVTNAAAATPGLASETDATLRIRQSNSTSLPALTPLESIYANIAAVANVQRLQMYENDTDTTDVNGIPDHSICAVVSGGDPISICTAIANTKSPGTGTYGTTTEVIVDQNGVPDTINFFVLTEVPITMTVDVQELSGWTSSTIPLIKAALAAWLNGLSIGQKDYLNKLWGPANLTGDVAFAAVNAYLTGLGQSPLTQTQLDAIAATFNVTTILQCRASDAPPAAQDVPIAFNEAAQGDVNLITVNAS